MIIYEQPLNEKMRLFLRLENLFKRFDSCLADQSVYGSHSALITLLELHDMSTRLDVKSAIIKTIDQQSTTMRSYENNTNVDSSHLNNIIDRLENKTKELYSYHGQLGQHLKTHHFLNTVKQRMSVSGGVNGIDLPIFNYWMNQPYDYRVKQMLEWIEPYNRSRDAVNIALDLIRSSTKSERIVALNGFYQSTMDVGSHSQLIQIELPTQGNMYPEVSAGKQRFSIRFVSASGLEERSKQIQDDVEFDLVVCSL